MSAYRPAAARNLPITTWRSLTGEVASSSIVPCRFSSAKRRMVSMGAMKSATTAMLWKSGRIRYSLSDSFIPPPPISIPCCATRIDCSRKKVKAK